MRAVKTRPALAAIKQYLERVRKVGIMA
jgi:hypothetical protein